MDIFSDWMSATGVEVVIVILIGTLLYIVGTAVVERVVTGAVKRTHQSGWPQKDVEKRQKTLVSLFTTLWQVIITVAVAAFVISRIFPSITWAPLFASAGIVGVALGFGAQSLVKDFLTGIFIIAENQYRVGDVIDIDGFSGTVERIGSRSTSLRDVEGNVHFFPNGMIQHVINKTMGYGVARFSLEVAPTSDLDKVVKIINATGEALAAEDDWQHKIIEPPSVVYFGELTATSMTVVVGGKTQPSDQWSVSSEMRKRLRDELGKHGVELGVQPFLASLKK